MKYFMYIVVVFVVLGASCNEQTKHQKPMSDAELRDQLIEFNKDKMNTEDAFISSYVEKYNLAMKRSDTGMRYKLFEVGEGDSISVGDAVEIKYRIRLEDSTLCYSSSVSGPLQMLVEGSDAPPGFHEVVQYMQSGDSAHCIWPARLGYGMTGDLHKIPLNAILLVDLSVKEL